MYEKAFPNEVKERVDAELSMRGADNRSDKMRIRRKVVGELWKENKDKPEVREVVDAAKLRQVEEKKAGRNRERIPEDYQK